LNFRISTESIATDFTGNLFFVLFFQVPVLTVTYGKTTIKNYNISHICKYCEGTCKNGRKLLWKAHFFDIELDSVAEPELEPVEQQLFARAGAGAKVFLTRLRSRV
jgi:hypothetical protein